MDHAPAVAAAAAASASGEAPRASDAIAGHEDAASMSTPVHDGEHILSLSILEAPAVRESIPLAQAETERQAVGNTEIDQQAEARQGGGNEGSLMISSGVTQAGSKRKAGASATDAKRAKQALARPGQSKDTRSVPGKKKNGQPRRAGRSRKTTQSASSDPPVSAAELQSRHQKLKPLNTFPDWEGVETALNEYASAAGFSFGVRNCKQLADKTTVSKMTWMCSQAGKPRSTSKKKPSSEKSPGSSSMRCQCPVSVTVWRKSDGILYISKSELKHNHTLATSPAASAHLAKMAKEKEESTRFEELKTCALELLRQASKLEAATKWAKSVLDQLQSDLCEFIASSNQNAVPESSNRSTVVSCTRPLAVHTTENDILQPDNERVVTAVPRVPTQASTTSLSRGPFSHGDRLDTLVSPDSSVDDVEHARVQLSPTTRRERQQRADMSRLLQVLEALHQGFNPPEDCLTWDFVMIRESCPPSTVLPYLQDPSRELRSGAESLLRRLFDFPNVMERGEFGPELVDVLARILLRRTHDEVRKYTDKNGGGDLVLINKAAPVSYWRIFEIQTDKPPPNNTDRVRFVRQINKTLLEVKSVARDVESLEYRFYSVNKTELRPVDTDEMEDDDPDEKNLLSEDELEIIEYCSALRKLCDQDSDVAEKLVGLGLFPSLVELLYISNNTVVCSSILRLLYCILDFKDWFPQVIFDSKLLEVIPRFLQSRSREIRNEALELLKRISSGKEAQELAMIQSSSLVKNFVEMMEWGAIYCGLDAAWVLSNMIQHATPEFATQMIDRNVIEMFSQLLQRCPGHLANIGILNALDRLMMMAPIESRCAWEECDLLSVIDKLTSNEETRLRKRAAKFMKKWNTNKRDREIGGSSDIDDGDYDDSDEEDSDE